MKQSAVDIDLTQIGDRLEIRFPYNADIVCAVKKLPNRSYHPEGRFWSIPFSAEAEILVRKTLGPYGNIRLSVAEEPLPLVLSQGRYLLDQAVFYRACRSAGIRYYYISSICAVITAVFGGIFEESL